jgi:hypothetical protein
MTKYAMYTTSPPDHTQFLLEVLAMYFSDLKQRTITDATSCIGGNARMFVGKFQLVNTVDISKLHTDILVHNFGVLELGKMGAFNVYTDNYLSVYDGIKQDIIFIDAPWGGVEYRSKKDNALYLNDNAGVATSLCDLIQRELFLHAAIIVIKVPKTYNPTRLYKMGMYKYINVIRIMNGPFNVTYNMIVLSHIQPQCRVPTHRILSSVNYKSVMERL